VRTFPDHNEAARFETGIGSYGLRSGHTASLFRRLAEVNV
jgi:hypothetical protein